MYYTLFMPNNSKQSAYTQSIKNSIMWYAITTGNKNVLVIWTQFGIS